MTIDELLENFELITNWEDRYRVLIDLGRNLPDFPEEAKTEENRVEGCTSQVWLLCNSLPGEPPRIELRADSDSFIVKGLLAILLLTYSGHTAEEIKRIDIEDIFRQLGLEQNLSPNRRSGFFATVETIHALAEKAA
ncbi:SufE family protein [Alkalilimnicola sp. S0819]|uniref:SufE family protein n=1 Tax=Alkalilimnicola sp. S0819 TaxID=2613922 RepID=UPI0012617D77|nr:SufE family protein [Alkalilimnicola sp. S0819]KAB7619726.1 SufE family protein [Alkalilimnicola sp. S0819]MPQ17489.1 cysteine desulfuration protein SufE [Alkalilimnicola sp. S0819]